MNRYDLDKILVVDIARILIPLLTFLSVGLVAVLGFGVGQNWTTVISTALMAAFAASLCGALLGLLFGIPRALTSAASPQSGTNAANSQINQSTGFPTQGYGGNSNLEQISDWLTKIVIGATLTQTGALYEHVKGMASQLATGLKVGAEGTAFAACLLVGFSVWGFLLGYLLIRRALPAILIHADGDGFLPNEKRLVDEAGKKIDEKGVPPATVAQEVRSLSPELERAASNIAHVPISLVPPKEIATWGRANLILGKTADAAKAFKIAYVASPTDTDTVESFMRQSLYEPPPDGFEEAIGAGVASRKTPLINMYLAVAYGQKHKWLLAHLADSEEVRKVRDLSFASAKAAVESVDGYKKLLAALMEPKNGSQEDDLVSLREDKEFRKLLELPVS